MEENGVASAEFSPKFLVGLDVQTHGNGGENLGCDEAETVGLGLVVVDMMSAQVVRALSLYVQPSETGKINWENLKERGIDQARVLTAQKFDGALQEIDKFLKSLGLGPETFVFVTDGQLPIRQVIYPEALKKNISLPNYYTVFADIRKEYRRLLNNNESLGTLQDIINYVGLDQQSTEDTDFKNCSLLGGAVSRLLTECRQKGLECFRELETVKTHLEHGICEKGDFIDGNTVVRARGLPWQSSDTDVARFFVGLNIARGGVALCLSNQGRRNGEALVRFESSEQRDMALRRHRHFMGSRYIEIYRATGDDFINVAAGNNTEAQTFLTRGAEVIVRMRGLPYEATAEQILEFFRSGEHTVEVMDGEEGILFVNKVDGRATGDAFVLFRTEEDAAVALAKHKEIIGTRYIELFRSTTAEVQQVINKSMEPPKPEVTPSVTPGLIGAMPTVPGLANLATAAAILPQQLVISGQKKDCIRLRGLPYEAQVQHILDFLGDYAKHIVFQGVHMVYNAQGHPSGEAFIQMDGEAAAVATATERHNKYMQIGKKQRYIEVFQCSADDMNLVLTGPATVSGTGIPVTPNILPTMATAAAMTQRPLISPAGGLLPGFPGGLASPTAAMTAPTHLSQPLINAQLLGAGAGLQNGYAAAIPGLLSSAAGTRVPVIPGLTGVVPVSNTGAVVYWPYPSPPVSPSNYYAAAQNQAALAAAQTQAAAVSGPAIILMRSLPFNTTTADILAFFQGYSELAAESVQIQRTTNGQPTGDALVTFPNRLEAERAILEKNRQLLGQRPVELFMCSM